MERAKVSEEEQEVSRGSGDFPFDTEGILAFSAVLWQ